jgi:hypothetical protein
MKANLALNFGTVKVHAVEGNPHSRVSRTWTTTVSLFKVMFSLPRVMADGLSGHDEDVRNDRTRPSGRLRGSRQQFRTTQLKPGAQRRALSTPGFAGGGAGNSCVAVLYPLYAFSAAPATRDDAET